MRLLSYEFFMKGRGGKVGKGPRWSMNVVTQVERDTSNRLVDMTIEAQGQSVARCVEVGSSARNIS